MKSAVAAAPVARSKPSSLSLSVQQQAVMTWVTDAVPDSSLFISAVAGSGKTTTLVEACRRMTGPVAFAAFNKKIVTEIQAKTAGLRNVKVGTFHSFGLAAWRRMAPTVLIDARMKEKWMWDSVAVPFGMRRAVAFLVSLCKQSAVVDLDDPAPRHTWGYDLLTRFDVLSRVEDGSMPEHVLMEELVRHTVDCLRWSHDVAQTVIDFDDMVWLPCFGRVPVDKYDWVLVDEAQDTNRARRLLAMKMMAVGACSLWVGDRRQAIYGFTGADSNSVDQIIDTFNCDELPLSVSYRCCKAASALASRYVPEFTPHADNQEGTIRYLGAKEFSDNPAAHLAPGHAVLCRNTKPLIRLAFQLIRNRIGAVVEGRDIGQQLLTLVGKWKNVTCCTELVQKLESYRQREIGKLAAVDAAYQIEALNDRIDSLLAVMDGCETVEEVRSRISQLFQDTEDGARSTVIRSTIHKAKGREWDTVFLLGSDRYMPSRFATQDWEVDQEDNLMYVALTRCKESLIFMEDPNV